MDNRRGLYAIQEPEARVHAKIIPFRPICSHEPASPRPLGRPWPRQVDWRTFLAGSGLESGPATRQQV